MIWAAEVSRVPTAVTLSPKVAVPEVFNEVSFETVELKVTFASLVSNEY